MVLTVTYIAQVHNYSYLQTKAVTVGEPHSNRMFPRSYWQSMCADKLLVLYGIQPCLMVPPFFRGIVSLLLQKITKFLVVFDIDSSLPCRCVIRTC